MINYDSHVWRDHLFDIKGSMVRQITMRVLVCVAWSVAVTAVHMKTDWKLDIPATGHTLITVALGLLLVFRTNSSYDRFWEGRKLWGAIVNDTRNLARAGSVQLAGHRELLTQLVQWTIAFPYAAMHRLRNQAGLGPISADLEEEEVQSVLSAAHPPLAVSQRLSSLLLEARQQGVISDFVQMSLDRYVANLIDSIGGCERIHNTPLPFAYVVHLRRALIFHCFTMPFALLEPFHWLTVPATLLIAYTMYGIEEIGIETEDPFGEDDNDLPLESICQSIERTLKGLLQQDPADIATFRN